MVRIPQPEPLFEEPDHVPELETQAAYEELRDGKRVTLEEAYPTDEERRAWDHDPWLGVDDDPPVAHRAVLVEERTYVGVRTEDGGMGLVQVHTGRRSSCNWPSHQRWAVEKFGRSRDDRHTDD